MPEAGPLQRTGVRIGTNLGPVAVTRFAHESAFDRSRLWLRDGHRASLDRDGAFAAFVDDLGPILLRGMALEPLKPGIYAEIDEDIGAGESWQLGALVAMLLASAGRFAGIDDEAGRLVYCTGEVAHSSGTIRPVELVAEKLEASRRALLARPRDCLWLVPAGNAAETGRVTLPAGVELRTVGRVDELPALLGIADRRRTVRAPVAAAPPASRARLMAVPLAAVLLAGTLLAGPTLLDRLTPAAIERPNTAPHTLPDTPAERTPDGGVALEPPPAETTAAAEPAAPPARIAAALVLELHKRRPQPGQSCLVQNFDHALVPLLEPAPIEAGTETLPALVDDPRLCGVDIRVVPPAGAPLFVLGHLRLDPPDGAVVERVGRLDGLAPLAAGAGFTVRLKPDRAVTYRLDLVAGSAPLPEGALGALDEPAARLALETEGFVLRRLTQRFAFARAR